MKLIKELEEYKMILSDKNNLYIKPGTIEKLARDIGLEGAGLFLTYKSFEFENPAGVEEMKLLKSSSDGVESNRIYLEKLIDKGYLKRNDKGLIISTNKQIL